MGYLIDSVVCVTVDSKSRKPTCDRTVAVRTIRDEGCLRRCLNCVVGHMIETCFIIKTFISPEIRVYREEVVSLKKSN